VPEEAIGCGFHEAVRGVLSHHVVIRKGKIANYHPYPPTPWNANPRDVYGTPGPYEDAVQNTPIFEENGPDKFKGIDIMRAVRSFDPCLPCGVHMYLGNGKTLETFADVWPSAVNIGNEKAGAFPSGAAGRLNE
jgi:hydrogenase large subunit